MADEAEALWHAVQACNRAWLEGRPHDTAELFAQDAVMVAPDLSTTLRGRDAIVASFVEYTASVQTLAFDVQAHSVEINGDVAVVTYRFAVTYAHEGARHDEVGQEVLTFARRAGGWQAVWRTQILSAGPR